MPPLRDHELTRIFNTVNSLSADVQRLAVDSRTGISNSQDSVLAGIQAAFDTIMSQLAVVDDNIAFRTETLHENISTNLQESLDNTAREIGEETERLLESATRQITEQTEQLLEDMPSRQHTLEVEEFDGGMKALDFQQALLPYRFHNMRLLDNDILLRIPKVDKEYGLVHVPLNVPYPRTKQELSQMASNPVDQLLEWYDILPNNTSEENLDKRRSLLAGYIGVIILP